MDEAEGPRSRKHWRRIYHALVAPGTSKEIALRYGVSNVSCISSFLGRCDWALPLTKQLEKEEEEGTVLLSNKRSSF